jgi:hypothetical protein
MRRLPLLPALVRADPWEPELLQSQTSLISQSGGINGPYRNGKNDAKVGYLNLVGELGWLALSLHIERAATRVRVAA